MKKKQLYWVCQVGGWAFYILLQTIFFGLTDNINWKAFINFFGWFVSLILITHCFRLIIISSGLLKAKLFLQIPTVIFSSMVLAIVFHFVQYLIASATNGVFLPISLLPAIQNILNFTFVFFFWSLIYFSFHFIENYKLAEISNLRYKASMNEIELNKLKSQLNPHFMFNAMNSIRALVDEDPGKAKEAITMLSNILRNTLMMEKNKLINFDEELKIVKDYLDLEHIRFEERLQYNFDISPESNNYKVPTLMIQTLVENGIKHGISKLAGGGKIFLKSEIRAGNLFIEIKNSGKFDESHIPETGFGLKSTKQRLELLFGDKSFFKIYNNGEYVITEVTIPNLDKRLI
ncbi:MAG: histidine kinase [Bacteroidia bacterium]|nr:histidine kinase [Bacteroidia bacterium]